MAIIRNTGGHVALNANDIVSSVVLNQYIQNGDVKIRPTNVTATIDLTDHDLNDGQIATGVSISRGSTGSLVVGSLSEDPRDIFNVGQTVRVSGIPLGVAGPPRVVTRYVGGNLTITAMTSDSITFGSVSPAQLGEQGGAPIIPTVGTERILVVESEDTSDHDIAIILHNGPSGGFTQQVRVTDTKGYPVNDVVKFVIVTNR